MPTPNIAVLSAPNPANAQRIASEAEIERQRELAQSFARQAAGTQRIANPLQGINYAAQNILSGVFAKKAEKSDTARRDALAQALTGALGDTSEYGIPQNSLRTIMSLDPNFGAQLLSSKIESQMNPPEQWLTETLPNGAVVQRSSKSGKRDVLFDVPKGNAPDVVELFDEATGQPYKAQYNPQTGEFERVGGVKAPSGTSLSVDPTTGAVTFQQGSLSGKPLTEQQSKDTVFATRAAGALPLIDQYGGALTSLPEAVGGQVPGVGNYLKTDEYQMAEQAGTEFLLSILRKDTGAAVTPSEELLYGRTYLPRPGDGPEVLEQKRQARSRALAAIEAGMPPLAILQKERALQAGQTGSAPPAAAQTSKPVTEMTVEELEAIINGQ